MNNVCYLCPLSARRLVRKVFFVLVPGVITILCHAGGWFPALGGFTDTSATRRTLVAAFGYSTDAAAAYAGSAPANRYLGQAPVAVDDYAATPEDSPVTVNVLANDQIGQAPGKDDDDDRIDAATVDLEPDAPGRQISRSTAGGSFAADDNGYVTFAPVRDFNGIASIGYTVKSLGGETSNTARIEITVTSVNDAPVITGWQPVSQSAVAGEPVTLSLSDFVFSDPDGQPIDDFSLLIIEGEHYTVSGNTFTPDAGFSGTLPVPVQVTDGQAPSAIFTATFTVTNENAVPKIVGQTEISIPEDTPFTVAHSHLDVEDPDSSWPDDFTIQVGEGADYTVAGTTITPAQNYSGPLSVPVTVNDGESTSEAFNLQITVTAVNDPPAISGQTPDPLTTGQQQPVTITLENLEITDPDDTEGFSLAIQDGENYSVAGHTITPDPAFSGMLTVQVVVSDSETNSDPFPLAVQVTPNTPPEIVSQNPLTTSEETPIAISLSDIQVSDPDDVYPAGFTFRLSAGDHYTLEGNTVVPAVDFAGTLNVPIIVNDGISDSEPFPLAITVTNINDAPVITGHAALTTPENASLTLELSHFTVSDPDNPYPEGFSLSILSGENYSASGQVITPATGYSGPLTVGVLVNDSSTNSEPYFFGITVTPVNDPPRITGQAPLQMLEGSSFTVTLQVLQVEDPDNTYPQGFTLTVLPGDHYTFSETTVTPHGDFSGTLYVKVMVNDGMSNSEPFALAITVTPQNDPPKIIGPSALATNEDVPLTITLDQLQVEDPDNDYPAGFTLQVLPGDHYTRDGNTIIPEANFNGSLTVEVQVSDGSLTSNIYPLSVQVVPVNDPPVITGQTPVETPEDTPVTLQLSHLTVLDVDNTWPNGFTMLISPGANYTVAGSTITPATDFNGTLNLNIMVNDGISNSAPFAFQIQVGNTNDAPVITGQSAVVTDEETPVTIQLSHLAVTDPDNPYPNGFSLLVAQGPNYTVSGTTVTPALNFAGELLVPVRVNDGINNSGTFSLKIQVNQINDAPEFAAIPNQQIPENTPAGSVTIREITPGPMEQHQELTFVATSGNTAVIPDPVVQYNGGTTAVLTYSVEPNISGVATITVVAIDNGSNVPPHRNAYSSSFQIEVLEINAAPTLDVINNVTVLEDAEQQNISLTGISAGPGENQALSVAVSSDKADFFDLLEIMYTSPETTGQLRFKTKPNIHGAVRLTVTVTDNGSGISPHANTISRTFTVVVQPVNDPPAITSQPPALAVINEVYEYRITTTDPDQERVTLSASQKPAWASLTNVANGSATLKGTPTPGAIGNYEVKLQASDASTSVEQAFTIYVNARPEISSLSLITEEDTPVRIPAGLFPSGYTDKNDNAMHSVLVATLPVSGVLSLSDTPVKAGDTISVHSLEQLLYSPQDNYFGMDSFQWRAFDGFHFSLATARLDISVLPVNDPPRIIFESDTLRYEVNGEPAIVAPMVDIIDPDDDTLSYATVGFYSGNFRPEADLLEFQNTSNIRGSYDFQQGIMQLTGAAPVGEYREALRTIRYLYRNTLDPLLEAKTVYFMLNDGEADGEPTEKVIMLQYTFVEFEIPTGFTPNGDQANDTWIIDRPGGGLEEMGDAIISVYNKRGLLVYRARGFETPWDGTMNGEALPAGTYFYTIDLQLRSRKTYRGIVTILR